MQLKYIRNTVIIGVRVFVIRNTVAVGISPGGWVFRVQIIVVTNTIAINIVIQNIRDAVTVSIFRC